MSGIVHCWESEEGATDKLSDSFGLYEIEFNLKHISDLNYWLVESCLFFLKALGIV